MTQRINSQSYWDGRFATDWDDKQGPQQSRFFSRVAIDNLPAWLFRAIGEQQLSVVDWGCAQGDGTDELATRIEARQLSGVDFSPTAVQQASERHPAIRFVQADWLDRRADTAVPEQWDIVFSSNTLEHFHQPFEVLRALCARARLGLVLVLPYRERDRIEEHHFSFWPESLPARLPNGFRLAWARVVDCRSLPDTHWAGEQIVMEEVSAGPFHLTQGDLFFEAPGGVWKPGRYTLVLKNKTMAVELPFTLPADDPRKEAKGEDGRNVPW